MAPPCTALNTKQKVNISKVFSESLPNVDATLQRLCDNIPTVQHSLAEKHFHDKQGKELCQKKNVLRYF